VNPLIVLGCALGLVVTPAAGMVFLGGGSVAAQTADCDAAAAQASLGPLTSDQLANATVIVDVGEQMTVPSYGQVVAIATALQESRLHNLNYGDADSLGLFQQRPSQGWGSPAQILDPAYATTQFYDHLLAVPGWSSMPLTQAAQAVQRSAFPAAYASWQSEAQTIVQQIAGGSIPGQPDSPPSPTVSTVGDPASSAGGQGIAAPGGCGVVDFPPGQLGAALSFAAAQVGKTYLLGATGPNAWDCSALIQAAYAVGGVNLPRTADEQYDYARAHGQVLTGPPTATQLQPGDLLFSPGDDPVPAADGNPIGHVALYAGGGVVIEAKGAAWGVIATTYTPSQLDYVTFVGRLVAAPASSQSATPPSAAASAFG
jgi:cell wall-associated NlpC family hydrolase